MSQPYDPGHGTDPRQGWGPQGPQQEQPPTGWPGAHPGRQGDQAGYPGAPQQGQPPQPGFQPPQPGFQPPGPYDQPGHPAPPGYQQSPYAPPPAYGAPPGAPGPRSPIGIGVAVAGAIMAIGTFLPWVTVKLTLSSSNIFGGALGNRTYSKSVAGIKAWEGKVVLLCAIVAIGLGIAAAVNNSRFGLFAAIPGGIAVLVLLKVLLDKANYDDRLQVPPMLRGNFDVSLSAGFWVSIVMAVGVIAAGVVSAVAGRQN